MANIVKVLFALPIAAEIVCMTIFSGMVVVLGVTLLATQIEVAVSVLLKLFVLSFIIFGMLWFLGVIVEVLGTTIKPSKGK